MRTVGIAKLKAFLSGYLLKVKAGEEIIVTERGKPVARLVPIAQSEAIPEHLREMEKKGLISLGTGKLPKGFWDLPRPKDPQGLVLKALLEEREHGR